MGDGAGAEAFDSKAGVCCSGSVPPETVGVSVSGGGNEESFASISAKASNLLVMGVVIASDDMSKRLTDVGTGVAVIGIGDVMVVKSIRGGVVTGTALDIVALGEACGNTVPGFAWGNSIPGFAWGDSIPGFAWGSIVPGPPPAP